MEVSERERITALMIRGFGDKISWNVLQSIVTDPHVSTTLICQTVGISQR